MGVRLAITILCGVGLYAALFMLKKSRRAARGELTEPSVVQTPRARVLGAPNALFGACYYVALAAGVWLGVGLRVPPVIEICLAASALATLVSLYLAFSLLYVTRMPCPYCWTAHVVNWLLLPVVAYALVLSY